jgi:hypothetical protein
MYLSRNVNPIVKSAITTSQYVGTITFAALQITRAPYVFPILPFHYLSSERYKNEKFWKTSVADVIIVECFWRYSLLK